MIFQHTIDKVLSGEKTQTRRLLSYMDDAWYKHATLDNIHTVTDMNGRVRFQVGKTYAVQAGRGSKSVGRIVITKIRKEDVRQISEADVKAEGFETAAKFFETWTTIHDTVAFGYLNCDMGFGSYRAYESGIPAYGYEAWREYLTTRPDLRYRAWALDFQLM